MTAKQQKRQPKETAFLRKCQKCQKCVHILGFSQKCQKCVHILGFFQKFSEIKEKCKLLGVLVCERCHCVNGDGVGVYGVSDLMKIDENL